MDKGPTHEAVLCDVASSDPLDGEGQRSDGGDELSPVSSQYSSCGESEFERYCSANSMMGTPSFCSSKRVSQDFVDSDFGSVKSLEGFRLVDERFPRSFEGKAHSLSEPDFGDSQNHEIHGSKDEKEGLSHVGVFEEKMEVIDNGGSSWAGRGATTNGAIPMLGNKAKLKGIKIFESEVGEKEDLAVLLKNVENVLLQGAVAARNAAENLLDCNRADEMDDDRCIEQDETSSRYEHSDGEDSMFNYASDGGSQPNAYYARNVEQCRDEDAEIGNLVLMNPSVAFGSNDWEDFELDGAENTTGLQIPDNLWEQREPSGRNETNLGDFTSKTPIFSINLQRHEQEKNESDITATDDNPRVVDKSFECPLSCSTTNIHSSEFMEAGSTKDNDGSDKYLESCSVYNIFEEQCPPACVPIEPGSMKGDKEREHQFATSDRASGHDDHRIPQQHLETLDDIGVGEASFLSVDVHRDLRLNVIEGDRVESSEVRASNSVSSWFKSDKGRVRDDVDHCENEITTSKGKDLEMNAFYDEFVHEMEGILLDMCDSPVARLKEKNTIFQSEQSSPLRDGGSTASTSGLDDSYLHQTLEINGIEVVGAKQRKGDISLGERLVGVREYTVYIIRVWSGNDQWEVERRYRDFYTLYRQLKTFFASREWILPSPWSSVERESRNFFGNSSPEVIAERSTLIQECLCSILQSKYYCTSPSALIWFLSPPDGLLSSRRSNSVIHQSTMGGNDEIVSSLGKTISLIVEIQPQKSVKELLDTQHYTCAGCHKHFDNGKTRMLEFVQTFGWGKPRFCEYTGQLFCSSCHTNETAVLPARVLHHWDFTPFPVSQLAKSYLDSIIDRPMLCVSAANPFLFTRVPTLLHIVSVRRKIAAMLLYIRCSFRRSIYRRLGYRKYLLETNDFFALRDLIDLSKGVFAALPGILEAVLKKIQEHITELCLECCDNGVPCGARQACDNPSSLIFPFQEEEEVRRCKSCKSVFHRHCFEKLAECPCGVLLKVVDVNLSMTKLVVANASDGYRSSSSSSSAKESDLRSPVRLLSSLFSIRKQDKEHNKESNNVILMGSLPTTSL